LLKAVYTNEGQILGAQVAGKCEGVDKRIDHLAMAIASKMNVFDLRYVDFAYAPQFSTAKDAVNHLASVCADALDGLHPSITWDKLQSVPHGEVQLIDVRTNSEYAKGTIPGAQLIPLNELRQRLDEVNKDKDVVVFCRVGLRGYIATRILQEHGFNRVRNLMGGYLLYDELSQASQSKPMEEIPNA
jgi:rhodanese-related sulfurtransferase